MLLGNCAEKKVILIAWDGVPSRLVRRRTSFTVEWSTRNWQSTLVGTGLMTRSVVGCGMEQATLTPPSTLVLRRASCCCLDRQPMRNLPDGSGRCDSMGPMVHWNRLAVLGPLSRKLANPVPRWWRLVALPVKRSTGRGGFWFFVSFFLGCFGGCHVAVFAGAALPLVFFYIFYGGLICWQTGSVVLLTNSRVTLLMNASVVLLINGSVFLMMNVYVFFSSN